ncbi:MAG: M1 family metallopeptidase [Rubricoccaceae bacterium]
MNRATAGAVLLLLGLVLGACRVTPEAVPHAAQPGVDVLAYRVALAVEPETRHVEGEAVLTVRHADTLAALTLGLAETMTVRAVRVGARAAPFEHARGRLRVGLACGDTLSRVAVAYAGTPGAGLYREHYLGHAVTWTDAWPLRAAHWLPAVHRPDDAATLDLSLAVPSSVRAVASGVPVRDSVAGGVRHARFVLERPAPVYTFAFALADFVFVEDAPTRAGVPVRHALLPPDADAAPRLARTAAVLDTLAALLGPYPYASYTTVQVPHRYAGMENAAAPFLQAALYRDRRAGRVLAEEVNIHEAVHQWFGNTVVPADWADLWLAEAPATYLTAVVLGRLDGPEAERQALARMAALAPADARRRLVPRRYARPDEVLSATVYQKGGAVWHLLRLSLGDAAFLEAVRGLATRYAARPLSTDAFQAEMEAAAGRPLAPLFAFWVHGTGQPTLRVRWSRRDRTLAWRVVGDEDTLAGLPLELILRQDGRDYVVSLADGRAVFTGETRPEVLPVGVPLRVRYAWW